MTEGPQYRLITVGGRLVETTHLLPSDIARVRRAEAEGLVLCPTCNGEMRVALAAGGPYAVHTGENPYRAHEPEDAALRKAKRLLAAHLRRLLPRPEEHAASQHWQIALDVPLAELGHLTDIVAVSDHGAKLAVELQAADLSVAELKAIRSGLEEEGIRCLWLLDGRRLQMTKSGGEIRKVMLEQLETALLACGEPILYLNLDDHELVRIYAGQELIELAQLSERRIGRAECLVRRYPLSQLRLRSGRWWLDTRYDKPQPPARALPENLAKRLVRLRAKQAGGPAPPRRAG